MRTTSSAFSSPSARPGGCAKRNQPRLAGGNEGSSSGRRGRRKEEKKTTTWAFFSKRTVGGEEEHDGVGKNGHDSIPKDARIRYGFLAAVLRKCWREENLFHRCSSKNGHLFSSVPPEIFHFTFESPPAFRLPSGSPSPQTRDFLIFTIPARQSNYLVCTSSRCTQSPPFRTFQFCADCILNTPFLPDLTQFEARRVLLRIESTAKIT